MSASAFEQALHALAIEARVESRGNLAIVELGPGSTLPRGELRAAVVSAARANGFTNVAVEVTRRNDTSAALPGA